MARPYPNSKVAVPGQGDGIPAAMCINCGAPDEHHAKASECVSYWRNRTAELEFRLSAVQGRKAIPRFVTG